MRSIEAVEQCPPKELLRPKFLILDSLRGLSAILVALYHFNLAGHTGVVFFSQTWLLVDFFFVLSGFVISYNYRYFIIDKGTLIKFQMRRFYRVYPLHLLMLFAFLVIEVAKFIAENFFLLPVNTPSFIHNNLWNFISNIFLVQNFVHPSLSWNKPSWSISAEFYTYFLYGVICILARKFYSFKLILVVLLSFICLFKYGISDDNVSGPLRCIFSFFLGCLVEYCFRLAYFKPMKLWSILWVSLLALTLWFINYYDNSFLSYARLTLLFAFFVFASVLLPSYSFVTIFLENKYFLYLGKISFGIYMVHSAVLWCITQFARVVFEIPSIFEGEIAFLQFKNMADALFFVGLGIVITVVLAHYSYFKIERRFYSS